MRFAKKLFVYSSKVRNRQSSGAVVALEAGFVERTPIHYERFRRVHRIVAHWTLFPHGIKCNNVLDRQLTLSFAFYYLLFIIENLMKS